MYATLKDVGRKRSWQESIGGMIYVDHSQVQRCELVEVARPGHLLITQNALETMKHHCRIGRVRVAKWVAIDPTESRDDSYAEPPLGYGIEAA